MIGPAIPPSVVTPASEVIPLAVVAAPLLVTLSLNVPVVGSIKTVKVMMKPELAIGMSTEPVRRSRNLNVWKKSIVPPGAVIYNKGMPCVSL